MLFKNGKQVQLKDILPEGKTLKDYSKRRIWQLPSKAFTVQNRAILGRDMDGKNTEPIRVGRPQGIPAFFTLYEDKGESNTYRYVTTTIPGKNGSDPTYEPHMLMIESKGFRVEQDPELNWFFENHPFNGSNPQGKGMSKAMYLEKDLSPQIGQIIEREDYEFSIREKIQGSTRYSDEVLRAAVRLGKSKGMRCRITDVKTASTDAIKAELLWWLKNLTTTVDMQQFNDEILNSHINEMMLAIDSAIIGKKLEYRAPDRHWYYSGSPVMKAENIGTSEYELAVQMTSDNRLRKLIMGEQVQVQSQEPKKKPVTKKEEPAEVVEAEEPVGDSFV